MQKPLFPPLPHDYRCVTCGSTTWTRPCEFVGCTGYVCSNHGTWVPREQQDAWYCLAHAEEIRTRQLVRAVTTHEYDPILVRRLLSF